MGFEGLPRKRIGEFLIEKGLITHDDADRIAEYALKLHLRFGEAAVHLGYIQESDFEQALGPQFGVDFFHLDPTRFPSSTQGLFAAAMMLKYGVLPLGVKTERSFFRKRLIVNVGMLDPGNRPGLLEAETIARAKLGQSGFSGLKVFLVMTDQFLTVLKTNYGLTGDELRQFDRTQIDPRLFDRLRLLETESGPQAAQPTPSRRET